MNSNLLGLGELGCCITVHSGMLALLHVTTLLLRVPAGTNVRGLDHARALAVPVPWGLWRLAAQPLHPRPPVNNHI
jgi:hypothetical protein